MPISDPDGYVKGHFKHVYEDIIVPACDKTGFKALRADQVKQSNLIHLDILQKLLDAPMAVCDLSSRNPNVLFELALRQAFDKPVALIQEVGTPAVFDISPFRYVEYRKERTYHEVLEDQSKISATIKDTFEEHRDGKGVNSIIKLLRISKPASLPDINATDATADIQQLILAELNQLRDEFRSLRYESNNALHNMSDRLYIELQQLNELLKRAELQVMKASAPSEYNDAASMLSECRQQFMRLVNSPKSMGHMEVDDMVQYEKHMSSLESLLARKVKKLEYNHKK